MNNGFEVFHPVNENSGYAVKEEILIIEDANGQNVSSTLQEEVGITVDADDEIMDFFVDNLNSDNSLDSGMKSPNMEPQPPVLPQETDVEPFSKENNKNHDRLRLKHLERKQLLRISKSQKIPNLKRKYSGVASTKEKTKPLELDISKLKEENDLLTLKIESNAKIMKLAELNESLKTRVENSIGNENQLKGKIKQLKMRLKDIERRKYPSAEMTDDKKNYVTVEFLETMEIQTVYKTWMFSNDEKPSCYCPESNVKKHLVRKTSPDKDTWEKWDVRVHGYSETLQEALVKEKRIQKAINLEFCSENEETLENHKRKRTVPAKLLDYHLPESSSSDSDTPSSQKLNTQQGALVKERIIQTISDSDYNDSESCSSENDVSSPQMFKLSRSTARQSIGKTHSPEKFCFKNKVTHQNFQKNLSRPNSTPIHPSNLNHETPQHIQKTLSSPHSTPMDEVSSQNVQTSPTTSKSSLRKDSNNDYQSNSPLNQTDNIELNCTSSLVQSNEFSLNSLQDVWTVMSQMQLTLADICANQRIMYEKIELLTSECHSRPEPVTSLHSMFAQLPLTSPTEFENFQSQLDDQLGKQFVHLLVSVGGRDLTQAIYFMLRRVMVDQLAMEFSFTGKNMAGVSKLPFRQTKVSKCILIAAQKIFGNHVATEAKVANVMGKWLQQAKVRHDRRGKEKPVSTPFRCEALNCEASNGEASSNS